MNYWLVKSEVDVYSIEDLEKDKITYWEGVRNYQARNFLREMKVGDKVLFYHSNSDLIGVVGLCEVVKEAYPDFTQFDPKSKYFDPKSKLDQPTWFMVDVKFVKKFKRIVTLDEIKKNMKLRNMKLVQRGNRLSVMPITTEEFNAILKMADE